MKVLFFNKVGFTVQALVVLCDEVLDFSMVELFPQIPHNDIDLRKGLFTCREPFSAQVCLYLGKRWKLDATK